MKDLRRLKIPKPRKSEVLTHSFVFFTLLLLTLFSVYKFAEIRGVLKETSSSFLVEKEIKITPKPIFRKINLSDSYPFIHQDKQDIFKQALVHFLLENLNYYIVNDSTQLRDDALIVDTQGKLRKIPQDSLLTVSMLKQKLLSFIDEFQIDSLEKKQIVSELLPLIAPNLVLADIKYDTTLTIKTYSQPLNEKESDKKTLLILYTILIFSLAFFLTSSELRKENDPRLTWVFLISYLASILYISFGFSAVEKTFLFLFPFSVILLALLSHLKFPIYLTITLMALFIPLFGNQILPVLLFNVPMATISIYLGNKIKSYKHYLTTFLLLTATAFLLFWGINYPQKFDLVETIKSFSYLFGISVVLLIAFNPFLEKILKYPTEFLLTELTNMNHPLLLKLQKEAPGTFEHSLRVAEIGAKLASLFNLNPTLARACGLYHDVGKIVHPVFFIENQVGRENPHDKISPEMSVQILRSHVSDGISLAKKYGLPWEIQRVISTHHGTSVMYSIYNKAKQLNPELSIDRFRYIGPKPITKLECLFMIIDSVEAASRALDEKSQENFEKIVEDIINDRLNDGQFSEALLTYRELEIIKRELVKSLLAYYHVRLKYHEDKGY